MNRIRAVIVLAAFAVFALISILSARVGQTASLQCGNGGCPTPSPSTSPTPNPSPSPTTSPSPSPSPTPFTGQHLLINAQAGGFDYSYSPSMIEYNGVIYNYFCSCGCIVGTPTGAWDFTRLSTSADNGNTWTPAQIVLESKPTGDYNFSACNPSVVQYTVGDNMWYMFYSSAYEWSPGKYQTVIQVARASSPYGPFLNYTGTINGVNQWEGLPAVPAIIMYPTTLPPVGAYGAGNQTVIQAFGEFWMWWFDNSSGANVT